MRTEEEFFHTFNALYDTGSQVVVSSDRLPRDLGALEQRLRERFEAGLVTDVRPPDIGTRLTILRMRAQHDGLDLCDEAPLRLIAERITDNVRALEGALIRVVAFASLTGRSLDEQLATEVLDELYPSSGVRHTAPRTISDVQQAACDTFGLTLDDLGLAEPRRAPRLAATDRHVPLARAHRARPSPRSAVRSVGAITPPSSMPASGRASGSRATPRPTAPSRTSPHDSARAPTAVIDRLGRSLHTESAPR